MSDLWDWRTRIATLYAEVRINPDPAAAWQHWRDTRDTLFRTHPQSPLDQPFQPLPYFPYDPALRLLVPLEPAEGPVQTLPAGEDGDIRMRPMARATVLGGQLTLFWIQGYGGGVFLPFADATRGQETYGAGRYLLDTIKGADLGRSNGQAVLDFNFAYNPSCAYSPRYVCPLAPAENRLAARVKAGEKTSTTTPSPASGRELPTRSKLAT